MKYMLVSACLLGVRCRYDGTKKADEGVLKLLGRKDVTLIPVCPEQLGGMGTPRAASERKGDKVWNKEGEDVTAYYEEGAREAWKLAELYGCDTAILKERSPSCGCGRIYDGNFTGNLAAGDGVTAQILKAHGLRVVGESEIHGIFGQETARFPDVPQ